MEGDREVGNALLRSNLRTIDLQLTGGFPEMARQGLLKATKPCNRRPRSARRGSPACRSHPRSPPPSPDNPSHSSAAGSTPEGVAQSSPDNWASAGARRTADKSCQHRPASDTSARAGSACPLACASASPAPGSATSGHGSASRESRTPAPESLSSLASSIDTLSPRFCFSHAASDASLRPLVSAKRERRLI